MLQSEDRLSIFPVFMKVEGNVVVVVGEGEEALAKARLLSESRAQVRLVAQRPSSALAAFSIQADLQHVPAAFSPAHLEGSILAFAATGELETDMIVAQAAREAGIPVNVVDRPQLCDFYTPALVNRAPVAVAIGSEGTGPVLTQMIRSRIEAMLPASTGRLARLAALYRVAVDRLIPRGAVRRAFWRSFFEGEIAALVERNDLAGARRSATRLVKNGKPASGFVSLVGAGPGAEDLLTLRAQRALQLADVIVHDRLASPGVIALGRRDAERIPVGKAKGCHSKSQHEINELLVSLALEGKRVVRLKAGDPMIFGRAGEEMDALAQAGIAFEIVPGVTAALAAAAEARIPLTLRGVASSLVFATGHDRDGATLPDWAEVALSGSTVAVYMGRTVAAKVARRLSEAGMPADTPVAILEAVSTPHQRTQTGTLADLATLCDGRPDDLPALILIGRAVAYGHIARPEPLASPMRDLVAA